MSPCDDSIEHMWTAAPSPMLLPPSSSVMTIDSDSNWVLHHMFSDHIPTRFQNYKRMWYPLCIRDPAAFHQMIACFSMQLLHWQRGSEEKAMRIAVSHHTEALALVRERLSLEQNKQQHQPVAQEYLWAILMFVCWAHLNDDVETWKMHMSAIHTIISSQNCKFAQDDSIFYRLFQWSDITGSYAFGLPSYISKPLADPLPAVSKTTLRLPLRRLIDTLEPQYRLPWLHSFQSLQDLNEKLAQLQTELGASALEDPLQMDALVNPVISRILRTRLPQDGDDGDISGQLNVLMGLRAGALLYMADMRRRCGIVPVRTTYQINVLIESYKAMENHPGMSPLLRLWLATTGALESPTSTEQHHFCNQVQLLASELDIHGTTVYQQKLEEVIFLDPIFVPHLSSLSQMLNN